MIKRLLLFSLLTLLYLVAFAAGSFTRPFGRVQVLHGSGLAVHLFVWDGVLIMLALYAVTLAGELAGRRLQDLWVWTTGSLAFAGLIGYLLRLGFVTREF